MPTFLSHYKHITINCKVCNKEYKTFAYRKGQVQFCGNVCRGISLKGKHISPATEIKKNQRLSPETEFKGDPNSYQAIHFWVVRQLGKAKECKMCQVTKAKFEWSNISQTYQRDLNDWQSLCSKCHRKFDKKYRDSLKDKVGFRCINYPKCLKKTYFESMPKCNKCFMGSNNGRNSKLMKYKDFVELVSFMIGSILKLNK